MRDWAASGSIKIDRANEHIRHLEAEISAFRERRPYPLIRDPDFDSTLGTPFEIHVREEIPPRWSAIAADAIHNLHVALDYMWQRAIYGPNSGRHDHFPAFPNPEAAEARFKGKEKGNCKIAVNILKSAGTFKKENPFWDIRCFDDADKHDTMALVAQFLTGFQIDASAFPDAVMPPDWLFVPGPSGRAFVIEQGAILYARTPMPKVDVNPELTFEIAFGEGEVLNGQAVLPTLRHLAQTVDSLAAAFAEFGLLT
jgi:hypothetical protein